MKNNLTLSIIISFFMLSPAFAEEPLLEPKAEPAPVPKIIAPSPSSPLSKSMKDMNTAVLRSIDKLYARTSTFEVPVGQTVKFGKSLFIRPQACRKTPPTKQPESAAFLQVWEQPRPPTGTKKEDFKPESKWIFSGWMFASSPALSALDHPVFDVWLIDCKNTATKSGDKTIPDAESAPPAAE